MSFDDDLHIEHFDEGALEPIPGVALDLWRHPITSDGRETVIAIEGQTLEEVAGPAFPIFLPAVASVDGALITRSEWHHVVLREGMVVQVRASVDGGAIGGGGGGGGSNPIAVVLSIAVIVAAPYAAAALLGTTVGAIAAGTAGIGASLLSAGIAIGGILVVNSLFPPRLPNLNAGDLSSRGDQDQPSPLYSLSGGANQARPYEPLLMLLGQHRMFPDLASAEYTEYGDDGDQYLNQIFDFGIGNLDIEEVRVGETLLSTFDSVETQTANRSGKITLVSGNVDTIQGGALEPSTPLTRTTAGNTTALAFDLVTQYFQVDEQGSINGRTVSLTLRYKKEDTSAWTSRTVSIGTPSGGEGRNVVRRTYKFTDLEASAYDVQVILNTTVDESEERVTFQAQAPAFRAYQDSDADFRGRNPIALRIKATGQLYGRVESLNAMVSAKVPNWNGTDWNTVEATSNPASILRWWYLGYRVNGTLRAGYGMSTSLVDDASLQRWHTFCENNSLECNIVISDTRDEDTIATMIAQCGWARVDFSTGKYGVLYENNNQPVTAVITPANIVAGSLNASYDNENLADEIIGTYLDRDSDFQENTLRRPVPQLTITGEFPVTIPLEGITDGEQAAKEINRAAAAQFYHQRIIKWEMTEEGFLGIGVGDVCSMANGLLGEGQGSRLVAIGGGRARVTLPFDVEEPQGDAWIWLPDGQIVAAKFTRRTNAREVSLTVSLPALEHVTADNPIDYRISLFPNNAAYRHVRVTAVEPVGPSLFRFTARDELPQYYAARVADLSHPLIPVGAFFVPRVEGFSVTENALGVRVIAWSPVNIEVDGYHLRYGASGSAWEQMTDLEMGLVQESPLELMDRPDSGTWNFAICAVAEGRRSAPTYYEVTLGDITRGLDGTDGNGFEDIFVATELPSIPNGLRPDNDWGFDIQPQSVSNMDGSVTVTYHDGLEGAGFDETNLYLWRVTRMVPGTPEQGANIAAAWVAAYARAGRQGETPPSGEWGEPVLVSHWGQDGPTGPQGAAGRDGTDGVSGVDGADGDDGLGVEYIFCRTAGTVSAIPTNQLPGNTWVYDRPANGPVTVNGLDWYDGAPAVTDALPLLWRTSREVPGRPAQGAAKLDTWSDWSTPVVVGAKGAGGAAGIDGEDGEGVEYIFAATAASVTTIPTNQLPLNSWGFDQPVTRNGLAWRDGAAGTGLGEARPKLWRAERKTEGSPTIGDAVTDNWSTPVDVSEFGRGIEFIFARTATANPPAAPSNSWGYDTPGVNSDGTGTTSTVWFDAAPSVTSAMQYLWSAQRVVHGSPAAGSAVAGNWTAPRVVGRFGPPGAAGTDGEDGTDATDIEYVFARTARTYSSGLPADLWPNDAWTFDEGGTSTMGAVSVVWTDGAPGVTQALPLLWRSSRTLPAGTAAGTAVTDSWLQPIVVGVYGQTGAAGSDGTDAENGVGVEFIFTRTESEDVTPASPNNNWGYDRPGTITGTADTATRTGAGNNWRTPVLLRGALEAEDGEAFLLWARTADNETPTAIPTGTQEDPRIVVAGDTTDEADARGRWRTAPPTLTTGMRIWFVYATRRGGQDNYVWTNPALWSDNTAATDDVISTRIIVTRSTGQPGAPMTGGYVGGAWTDPKQWRNYATHNTLSGELWVTLGVAREDPWPPDYTTGFTYDTVWSDAAPNLSDEFPILWMAQRATMGEPNPGDTVTADWTSPRIISGKGTTGEKGSPGLAAPRQWKLLWEGSRIFDNSGMTEEPIPLGDISQYDFLACEVLSSATASPTSGAAGFAVLIPSLLSENVGGGFRLSFAHGNNSSAEASVGFTNGELFVRARAGKPGTITAIWGVLEPE